MATGLSLTCEDTLRLLAKRHNVLVAGPPATGKSRLLAEVAFQFEKGIPTSGSPYHDKGSQVAIKRAPLTTATAFNMPSADRTDRRVFRTTLHQGSKNRDFITGIVPNLAPGAATQFKVHEGILYRASEHALTRAGASLLIIDEINRGPAVQVFGGAIVAMESEKRLAPDGLRRPETQSFELLDPRTGSYLEYAFPHHLYILAAMNQADVSVEPLDVAFLRRWTLYPLQPDIVALNQHYNLDPSAAIPATPATAKDVYAAAIRAWLAVNDRIALGRGPEFRIGHGVLMAAGEKPAATIADALEDVALAWRSIKAHVDEAFFGDIRGAATVLNAGVGGTGQLYQIEQRQFGDMPREMLVGPAAPRPDQIHALLLAIADSS